MPTNRSSNNGNSNSSNSSRSTSSSQQSSRQSTNSQNSTTRQSTETNGTAVALNRISGVIDKNTQEIKKNTSAISQNTTALGTYSSALRTFARDFSQDAQNLSEGLREAGESIGESMQDAESQINTATTNMARTFERSNHNNEQTLSTAQKVGKSLLAAFEVVGSRIVSEFLGGAERVAQSYKDHLANITVRMQMDKSEYSAMYNDIAKTFKEQGLDHQFSAVDFAESLTTALDEGLRGDEAKRQAYQNLIANKLVPALNTNTTAYRRMSKEFGDAFTENTIAVARYSERLYGGEGTEENIYNETMDTLETTLRYAASTNKMSDEDVANTLSQFQIGIAAMQNAGIDTSDFTSNVQAILEGNVDAVNDQFHSMGIGTADDLLRALQEDTIGLFERYTNANNISSDSLHAQNENTHTLGGNVKTGMQIVTALNNGDLDWKDIRTDYSNFNSEEEFKAAMKELTKNQYQSADAMADKFEENTATALGVFQGEIPRFKQIADDVSKILGAVISIATSGNGIGGVLGNLLGKGARAVGTGLKNLGSSVVGGISNFGGASSLGGGLLNLALGPGALIGGAVMGGIDAFNAGKVASDNGASAGEVALQGLRGLVTGGREMTHEESQDALMKALNGERTEVDFGKSWKNAGKGALIGAGIGTGVGGWAAGVGTLIGGAIGGIAGFFSNLGDQIATKAKFNKLAKASEALSGSMDKLRAAQSQYDEVVESGQKAREKVDMLLGVANSKSITAYNELNQALGKPRVTSEELDQALQDLRKEYPQYIKDIKDVNDLEPQYLESLKLKIEQERKVAGSELDAAAFEAAAAMNDQMAALKDINDKDLVSDSLMNFVEGHQGLFYSDATKPKDVAQAIKNYSIGGIHGGDLTEAELTKQLIDQGFITGTYNEEDGTYSDLAWVEEDRNIFNGNDKAMEFVKKHSPEKTKAATATLRSTVAKSTKSINEVYQSLASQWDAENSQYTGDPSNAKSLIETEINNVVDQLFESTDKLGWTRPFTSDNWEYLKDISNAVGATLSFKVGAYNIPSDETYAHLHKGEMVLTADNADQLRNLGSGGIESLLQGLSAVSTAQVVATLPDTTSIQSVTSAIENQTSTIVAVLNNILDALLGLSQTTLSEENSVTISEGLLTFSGV